MKIVDLLGGQAEYYLNLVIERKFVALILYFKENT